MDKITIDDDVNKMRKDIDIDILRKKPINKRELNELIEYFLKETNEE